MDSSRKLHAEIDRVIEKVHEGVQVFDNIWKKIHNTEDANQKDIFQADLKKEIKKLQQYRNQIKMWIQSRSIKDKQDLMAAKKQIEREIELFMAYEKETRTKVYKEGLDERTKTNSKEKAKAETRDWLNNVVRDLESQIENFEAEVEGLSSKRRKQRLPRLVHLEIFITRHKAHIRKLKSILRLLDNDELSPEQVVNDAKDFLDKYAERNQEDFDELSDDEELYSTLPMKGEALEEMVALSPSSLVEPPLSSVPSQGISRMDNKVSTAYDILERMLLDESAEPMNLPLSLLEAITNDFSHEQEIGRGGFAVVYKGMVGDGMVAVKKLFKVLDVDEEKFSQEVQCLMKVQHTNIVRFLGYCGDTQRQFTEYEGKFIMADVRNRLLCFEFVPNGSLHDYISDASHGLEWRVRYKMIEGICEGLNYLHEKHIVHLDLKPTNILLDNNMVPKIADFGISRCFDEMQSKAITTKVMGSLGYLAPEYFSGQITYKSDIYSLGVIITEIVTGKKGYCTVEKVLESWRNRLEISQEEIPVQVEQVRTCAEIGTKCTDPNPENRPMIHCIIKIFNELGSRNEFVEARERSSSVEHTSVLSTTNNFESSSPS